MIPQDKTAAVSRALREAFDVTEFEDVRRMTKGQTSALVFRIVVRGKPYLLRIIMYKNSMLGPERNFTCMRTAGEAGIAPHVWYTSVPDQISITDFVEEVPLPPSEALVRMPIVLRNLHALPPFPKGVDFLDTSSMFLLHKGAATEGFIEKFKAASLLSTEQSEQLFSWLAQIAAVYPRNESDMVSSHNDLFKPDNVLFDGARVWVVDWEAAFLNDRYFDLAVVANLIVNDDAEERAYLERYFGQPPEEYQLARFFLMRQLVHIFYTMGYLFLSSREGPVIQPENLPDFKVFKRRMWTGEVSLADKDTRIAYGWIHWQQLRVNMQQPARFDEALRIVATR